MHDRLARLFSWRSLRRLLLGLLLIVCGLTIGTGYRLTRGPVVLPEWSVARLEQRINRDLGAVSVDVGEVALSYDLTEQALLLRVRQMALADVGAPLVAVPEARVALDGGNLIRGRLRPRSVDFNGLALDVVRDAEGRINLSLGAGGGGGLPDTPAEALAALDRILATPAIAKLDNVRLAGITLRARDEITGISQDVTDGRLALTRMDDGVRLTLTLSLPVGAGRASDLALTLTRRGSGQGAQATVALVDLPLAYLAATLPRVPALSLATGSLSASAALAVNEDGSTGPLRGRVEARDLLSVDRSDLAIDRAAVAFDWLPGTPRIGLSELSASSDALLLGADGQVLIDDGVTGPIQVQLRMGETILNPDDMFEQRVAFTSGVLEARLSQAPLALHLGQAMVTGPSGTARLSGRLAFEPAGIAGNLALAVPEMAVDQLKALWPPKLQVQARTWFVNNMLGGTAREVTGALRLKPGQPPEVLANFAYEGGQVRFMRFMPPAENARGAAQFNGRTLAMRVDAAEVPALGPDDVATDETAMVRIDSARFSILDATERPPRGGLSMRASGQIGDVMTMLNNRPLRLLQRLRKDRSFVTGQAEALVEVELPLRKGNAPADIDWRVDAVLRDVVSDGIIPGRRIRAQTLDMTAAPEAIEIGGSLSVDGIPFTGSWRQALPPRGTTPIDPEAPPPPPVPLPEPGRVAGVAQLSPEALQRLGIDLGALDLSGQTGARVQITLPQGQAPRLALSSDLRGLSVALPAVSWTKPSSRAAEFAMEARLGASPEVTSVRLDAPGLQAQGRVALRSGGGLDRAEFERVDVGWFRGPLTLIGRGAGSAPRIEIGGGAADLRRALLRGGGGGSGGSGGSPLSIALDRLTVTEGIALTNLRANIQGGSGDFTARLNGGAAIEGVLARQGAGSAVEIRGADAGAVLQSSGLFRDARGGTMQFTLRPTGRAGIYDGALRIGGLRIRNAPALASLLQALSVVGILEQLDGEGLSFDTVESDFTLRPDDIVVRRASAVGPSMSITADGTYDIASKTMDMQGVISPIYLVNGLFGALFARRDEGLFGFTYRLTGAAADPAVNVNPLSILTPGVFREIFRSPPPEG